MPAFTENLRGSFLPMLENTDNQHTISVAMATYNAEVYIEDQLASILAQTRLPDEMVIFDDCSTDATFRICQNFANTAPFPVIFHQNRNNLGFGDNFLACAERCTGSWILFCDQDDIWTPNKIKRILEAIVSTSINLSLICHSANVVTEELIPLNYSIPKIVNDRLYPAGSKPPFWFVGGCVMCFSSKLLNEFSAELRPIDNYPNSSEKIVKMPHDKWICYIANASGGIFEIAEPLMMYRRHANATSAYNKKVSISQRAKAIFSVEKGAAENMGLFCRRFADSLRWSILRSGASPTVVSSCQLYSDLGVLFSIRAEIHSGESLYSRLAAFFSLYIYNIQNVFRTDFFKFRHAAKDLIIALRLIR